MWSFIATPLSWLGFGVVLLSFGLYILLQLVCGSYYKYQNLKERYNAEWALVTGASTGVYIVLTVIACKYWNIEA